MINNQYILGIETSCDDTCIAILNNGKVIASEIVNNNKTHQKFGGIVPELASRNHEKNILKLLTKILKITKLKITDINVVAYTYSPGLIGCLQVGIILAKTLNFLLDIPIYAVNHIHAHIFSSFINSNKIDYPFLSLIVSGKTSSFFFVKNINSIIELSKTNDDAIGEIYDKIGRKLGLDFPGGPNVDRIFNIEKATINFLPAKIISNFSYSGLKSQVINYINKQELTEEKIIEIASSFQKCVIDDLINKINYFMNEYKIDHITIGGGVACNSYLTKEIKKFFLNCKIPEKKFIRDNAAMIAYFCFLNKFNNLL